MSDDYNTIRHLDTVPIYFAFVFSSKFIANLDLIQNHLMQYL